MDYKKANYYEGDSYKTGITKHIYVDGTNAEILITVRYTNDTTFFNKKYRYDISVLNYDVFFDKKIREEIYRHIGAIIKGREMWEGDNNPKPSGIFITLESRINKGMKTTFDAMECRSVKRSLGLEDDYKIIY